MDIKYVKDNAGNNFFPLVHERGVVDDNGTTLESKLQSKQDVIGDIDTIRNKANSAIYTETDPTVPAWAKASTKPSYTASEVGALPDTTSIPTESTVASWGFTKNTGTVTYTEDN